MLLLHIFVFVGVLFGLFVVLFVLCCLFCVCVVVACPYVDLGLCFIVFVTKSCVSFVLLVVLRLLFCLFVGFDRSKVVAPAIHNDLAAQAKKSKRSRTQFEKTTVTSNIEQNVVNDGPCTYDVHAVRCDGCNCSSYQSCS